MKTIVFHAKKNKGDQNPFYTVRFGLTTINELLCTISKPRPYIESYCKKTGNKITEERLLKFENEIPTRGYINIKNTKELSKYVPNGVAKSLPYYIKKAKRHFKVECDTAIVRGSEIYWHLHTPGSLVEKETIPLYVPIDND